MKNKFLPLFVGMFLASTMVFSQGKCGTYEGSFEDQKQKYPAFFKGLESLNTELEADCKSALSKMKRLKVEGGKRIIPVVVHVIHDLGSENLSDAAIQGAIDALNKNINGQSDKFLNQSNGYPLTPDIFASVVGVANIEFRLAKIDPSGNHTTGILRVQSELTNQPENRNAVKGLSYWNSYQYFNIWTLKKFADQEGGELLGFAQFPWTGSMSTDGVVLKAGEMSDVNSTTLTHEAGHWLGLKHIWGDAECGDDGVKDTPTHKYSNGAGENPGPFPSPATFPYHVGTDDGCVADSLNPAGEMYMNYMDYTNDNYVTMFSAGQVGVMNETLDGEYDAETNTTGIGFREYMWSADNIALTGVADGYVSPICNQNSDFASATGKYSFCLGENIVLKGNKTQFPAGTVSSLTWDFGDGNTDDLNANSVVHTYASEGSYDVSLTIEYDEITESRAARLSDLDLVNATSYDSIVEILNVQGTDAELLAMNASNINLHLDDDGYSINSIWVKNQLTTDSILDASRIDTLVADSAINPITVYINYDNSTSFPDSVVTGGTDSIWIHIDGNSLSAQDLLLIGGADSVWNTDLHVGSLDTIIDYNFYYDTTVLNILTFIDSTYLSAADSAWLDGADSSWSVDGVLASDSIRVYFAHFNMDTMITISINPSSTSLSYSESLMFNTADSTWSIQTIIGSVDTIRTYHAQFNYPSYNGYYIDTLFYRGVAERTTYIAYYANSCVSTTVKENVITISPASSSNAVGSYAYDFEDANELTVDWQITKGAPEGEWSFNAIENSSWEWVNGVAVSGSAGLKIDKDNLSLGTDELISVAYDLSALTSPAIKFSYSGASINTFPVNELNVYYSDDCGEVWRALGSLSNIQVANAGLYVNNFRPESSEWNDTVMTKSQLKNDNIKFKIEYVTNGTANNFYLDNIQIGEESTLHLSTKSLSRLSIYPNPTSGIAVVELENLAEMEVEVKLVNILGAEVMHLFDGEIVSDYHRIEDIDLSILETGIYFVKVVSNGNAIKTEKLILNK
ncbi:zinc-dependent metalloprotease [Flavobacteriales bacterium]|nr:zinc-dependent metalloprotease [Flavobacteriales bacterium]